MAYTNHRAAPAIGRYHVLGEHGHPTWAAPSRGLGFEQVGPIGFAAMEYLEGVGLDVLLPAGALTLDQVVRLGARIARRAPGVGLRRRYDDVYRSARAGGRAQGRVRASARCMSSSSSAR